MKYNEYIAEQGKVLFNLKTFTYGNKIITKNDYSNYLIQIDKNDAETYSKMFENKQHELRDIEFKKQKNIDDDTIMTQDDSGEYVETQNQNIDEQIDAYRKELGGQLLTQCGIDKNFQTITHNTKN